MAPAAAEDYRLGAVLGKGSFGVVYRATQRADGQAVVLKRVSLKTLTAAQKEEARNEVALLRSLVHPRIVRYHASFVDANGLSIVMEYAVRGDLQAKIKSVRERGRHLTERAIWRYSVQTLAALAFIHDEKVLHRDLKPANIFLDCNGDAKLGDFGVSRLLTHTTEMANTRVGTPYYMSPELCRGEAYSAKSDIWALGCVVYELCELKTPFDAGNIAALVLKIVNGSFAPLSESGYSNDLVELIRLCLTSAQAQRPTASELLALPSVRDKRTSEHRPETPSSPDQIQPRKSGRASLAEDRPTPTRPSTADIYAPRAPGRKDKAAKARQSPPQSGRNDKAAKARQSPPQRQRQRQRLQRQAPLPRVTRAPVGEPCVSARRKGGKPAAVRHSKRDREIQEVRALPKDPTPPTAPARALRNRERKAEGAICMGEAWDVYADVLPATLMKELKAARVDEDAQPEPHSPPPFGGTRGGPCPGMTPPGDGNDNGGRLLAEQAESDPAGEEPAEHDATTETEQGNDLAGGVIQTAWRVVDEPRQITPRMDDDPATRRARQHSFSRQDEPAGPPEQSGLQPGQERDERHARQQRTFEQLQQMQMQLKPPEECPELPESTLGRDSNDAPGWKTLARHRAVSTPCVEWDEAVLVDSLSPVPVASC